MKRSRFIAPPRGAVPDAVFTHPIFAAYRPHLDLLRGSEWPATGTLDARLHACSAAGRRLRFATQDTALLEDGLHYEARIHDHGLIATRPANWHDLLNALVWFQHTPLKCALNLRQMQEIASVGPRTRSRAQCALTHFDEAGAVVWLQDEADVRAWDAHDWAAWFGQRESFSNGRIQVHIFGHALLEHALWPGRMATAKCLVLCGGDAGDWQAHLASAIRNRQVLDDPQELRPLPLAGLPGWSQAQQNPDFFAADMFRPLRPGRRYPRPVQMKAEPGEAANPGSPRGDGRPAAG